MSCLDNTEMDVFRLARTFLESIGITVEVRHGTDGFLPGLRIEGCTILVAQASDEVVGDVLHEAGHVAVTPSLFREHLSDNVSDDRMNKLYEDYLAANPDGFSWPEDPICRAILQADEQAAIAWSFAAALAIGIDTMLPFKNGFEGGGEDVHLALSIGQHLGINGLRVGGMTGRRGATDGFPAMVRWMQI